MSGRLSIIATPIGNLEDVTLRALRTLRECDIIFCEDTRVTAKLLARHDISGKPLHRLDAHATAVRIDLVVAALREEKRVVYTTDAGTPGVSDPGTHLIATILAALPEAAVEPIPGPSALTALLSVADFAVDRFTFLGFLPVKKGRRRAIERIVESVDATVFFESPHRITRTFRDLTPLLGDRRLMVGRELTKLHETIYRGTAGEVLVQLEQGSTKGEIVVAIAPASHQQRYVAALERAAYDTPTSSHRRSTVNFPQGRQA